jgi:hypothetical protein
MGSSSIVFNQSNLVPSTYQNQYTYTFQGGRTFKNDKVAVKSISLYYSWKNITAAYGNNVFQIIWPTVASSSTVTATTTYTVTIPDGNYSTEELNTYIEQYCITNSLYLYSTTNPTQYTYYISCQPNSNYYSTEFDFYPIPTTAAQATLGLSQPAGWPTTNTFASAFTPQLIVPAATTTNSFSSLIGYQPGTYPSTYLSTVNVGVQSTFAPQASPIKSIIVGLSIAANRFGSNNAVVGTFAFANTKFGQIISYTPPYPYYTDLLDGSYNNITLTFWDQNFQPLPIYDPNITADISILHIK